MISSAICLPLTLATVKAGSVQWSTGRNDHENLRAGCHQDGDEEAYGQSGRLGKAARADNSAEASLRKAVGKNAEESRRKSPACPAMNRYPSVYMLSEDVPGPI